MDLKKTKILKLILIWVIRLKVKNFFIKFKVILFLFLKFILFNFTIYFFFYKPTFAAPDENDSFEEFFAEYRV